MVLETSFLGGKSTDRNTRRSRGRHGRRERWKRRIRKYRTFDVSLYDTGIYDLFSIEDLNYGFERFWLRRKLRNHRVRFRFFPGPWMRNFKKQLAKPRLESYTGPRIEFFRILFEQVYHPSFQQKLQKPIADSHSKVDTFSPLHPNRVFMRSSSFFPLVSASFIEPQPLTRPDARPLDGPATHRRDEGVLPFSRVGLILGPKNKPSAQQPVAPSKRLVGDGTFSGARGLDGRTRPYRGLLSGGVAPKTLGGTKLFTESGTLILKKKKLRNEKSTLRKFVRKLDRRLKMSYLSRLPHVSLPFYGASLKKAEVFKQEGIPYLGLQPNVYGRGHSPRRNDAELPTGSSAPLLLQQESSLTSRWSPREKAYVEEPRIWPGAANEPLQGPEDGKDQATERTKGKRRPVVDGEFPDAQQRHATQRVDLKKKETQILRYKSILKKHRSHSSYYTSGREGKAWLRFIPGPGSFSGKRKTAPTNEGI